MLWNLWHYVSDNRSRESELDLKKVPGVRVGVVVFQNARSQSQSRSRIFLFRLRNPGSVA